MYKVQLRLSGYTPNTLKHADIWLKNLAKICNASTIKSWSLPRRHHLITVLKSPHVNKKSREQFIEKSHGRTITINYMPAFAQVFLYIVEHAHFPGVELSVKVEKPSSFPTLYCIYLNIKVKLSVNFPKYNILCPNYRYDIC